MLAAEVTRPTPAIDPALSPALAPPPRTDALDLGATLSARAMTDPAAAAAEYRAAMAVLSPVEQGELARTAPAAASFAAFDFDIPGIPDLPDLPSLPGLPDLPGLPGLPDIDIPNPLDVLRDGIERAGDALEALQRGANAVADRLAELPHEVADRVADSMRGDSARPLTGGERAFVAEAFGNRVDLGNVRFVDGAGNSPIARAAFANGNPAITVGDTVYFDSEHFSTDFLSTAAGRNLLAHELTHVVQYEELGYGTFGSRYASEFAEAGGDASETYDYGSRDTTYETETLEGQAQMVGDYAEIRLSTDPADQATIADLEARLEGTGIYGL